MFSDKLLKLSSLFYKTAQDSQLQSSDVIIENATPVISKAVQLLKRYNSSIFVGVRKIVVTPSHAFGFVNSSEPTIVHLNLSKIVSGTGNNTPEEIIAVAEIISHEIGHVKSYKSEKGFEGGEVPAEKGEQDFLNWVKANRNNVKDILGG
jgi:hypothetical protein